MTVVDTKTGVELESLEYQRGSETYRAEYDRDTTTGSEAVVASLLEVMDRDPIELDPLYASINTDALDELVRVQDTTASDVSITFTIDKYAITVYSYGTVAIAPPERDRTDDPNEGEGRE